MIATFSETLIGAKIPAFLPYPRFFIKSSSLPDLDPMTDTSELEIIENAPPLSREYRRVGTMSYQASSTERMLSACAGALATSILSKTACPRFPDISHYWLSFAKVTPLDVVKTRLQSQEAAGSRHLNGTAVWILIMGFVNCGYWLRQLGRTSQDISPRRSSRSFSRIICRSRHGCTIDCNLLCWLRLYPRSNTSISICKHFGPWLLASLGRWSSTDNSGSRNISHWAFPHQNAISRRKGRVRR